MGSTVGGHAAEREQSFWDTFWAEESARETEHRPTRTSRRTARESRAVRNSIAAVGMAAGLIACGNAVDAHAATVLTVAGNGLLVRTPMSQELRGDVCSDDNVCQTVDYFNSGIGPWPLQQGLTNLSTAISTTSGPKIVLAYSQGGMIATSWIEKHASDTSDNNTTFILFGNPDNAKNGVGPAFNQTGATPTDTVYRVIDVCREYDSECDWPSHPNLLSTLNSMAGYLSVHLDYTGVNVNDPSNLVSNDGNTTFVLVPTEDLPLLDPLRALGLTALADQLNAQLKPIVDSAYNRTGYTELGDNTVAGYPTPATQTPATQTPATQTPAATLASSAHTLLARTDASATTPAVTTPAVTPPAVTPPAVTPRSSTPITVAEIAAKLNPTSTGDSDSASSNAPAVGTPATSSSSTSSSATSTSSAQ